MAVSLTTLLPPTRSGRTLFFSSSVLGTFALLQMAMLCWHLLQSSSTSATANNAVPRPLDVPRGQPAPGAPAIHFAETIEPSTSSLEVPYRRSPQATDANAAAPAATNSAPLPAPAEQPFERPTPAEVAPASVAGMIEHARRLRLSGDATTALAELRQAQIADPSSPQVIAELGITYEAMQLTDRAFEQWQRLYNMGTGIGALYYLADEKLHNAPPPQAPPAPGTALPGLMPDQAPPDATGSGRDNAGFQDNALLKITDIHVDDANDPAVGRKVALKIVVKNRPGTVIDPKKVHIETYFYDLLDGKDVVQTNEQTETTHQWLTTPVNWANDQSEVLETTYFRSKDADGAAPTPTAAPATAATADDAARAAKRGRRSKGRAADAAPDAPPAQVRAYLGYSVRLYYDRQLQDVRADPLRLLQQFPPQLTLTDQ